MPTDHPPSTRGARRRFVAALTVYGLWIASLAAMAVVSSRPPDPEAGVNPGAEIEVEVETEAEAEAVPARDEQP